MIEVTVVLKVNVVLKRNLSWINVVIRVTKALWVILDLMVKRVSKENLVQSVMRGHLEQEDPRETSLRFVVELLC